MEHTPTSELPPGGRAGCAGRWTGCHHLVDYWRPLSGRPTQVFSRRQDSEASGRSFVQQIVADSDQGDAFDPLLELLDHAKDEWSAF